MEKDTRDLTLREYLQQVYIPLKQRIYGRPLKKQSVSCCLDIIVWWEQLTDNPPVGCITQAKVDEFLNAVATKAISNRRKGFSYATRRKMASQLRALLRPLESRDYVPFGLGILPTRIWVCVPPRQRRLPSGMLHVVDVAAQIIAMQQVRMPDVRITGVYPGVWWKSFLGWLYFTGMRVTETLLTTWEMIDGDLVTLPGEIRKHGVPHMMVLHPVLREWLEPLRARNRDRGRFVFGCTDLQTSYAIERQRTDVVRRLDRCHEQQRKHFELPKTPQNTFHAYRKTHLTELALISDLAAQLSSSHGGNSLMTKHYLEAPRVLRKAIAQLPVPPVDELERQLRAREGDNVGTLWGGAVNPQVLREIVSELKANTTSEVEV